MFKQEGPQWMNTVEGQPGHSVDLGAGRDRAAGGLWAEASTISHTPLTPSSSTESPPQGALLVFLPKNCPEDELKLGRQNAQLPFPFWGASQAWADLLCSFQA